MIQPVAVTATTMPPASRLLFSLKLGPGWNRASNRRVEKPGFFALRRLAPLGRRQPPPTGRTIRLAILRRQQRTTKRRPGVISETNPYATLVGTRTGLRLRARRFPGWPAPVLVLSDENQGVCSWGVPLDGDGRVLVGGDLFDDGQATVP
jgi:hypothetical protein